MSRVLVLNAALQPLHICGWRRAVNLIYKGFAETVEDYGIMLREDFPSPKVIRLTNFYGYPQVAVALSFANVLIRDRNTCQYCGTNKGEMTVDHVIPKSQHGQNTWENLVTACSSCNKRKGGRSPRQANMRLIRRPQRPRSRIRFEIHKHAKTDPDLLACWLRRLQ